MITGSVFDNGSCLLKQPCKRIPKANLNFSREQAAWSCRFGTNHFTAGVSKQDPTAVLLDHFQQH
jgi:hypothetical protein